LTLNNKLHDEAEAMLAWSALLHEVGISISYGQHHKHAAYIIQHSDIDGFTQQEKAVLAFLVRAHRRRFSFDEINTLPRGWRTTLKLMVVALRIAALMHHRRCDQDQPRVKLSVSGNRWQLNVSQRWLRQHELVATEIAQEAAYLKEVGIVLRLN
jgi:exopolyphosphatase/guanosine-5'-triphosphate,3'-diphosphate pyrophosphatase